MFPSTATPCCRRGSRFWSPVACPRTEAEFRPRRFTPVAFLHRKPPYYGPSSTFFVLSRRFMRYLVTGGAGFIGSHIVHELVRQNHDVVVLDNFSTGKRENLDALDGRIEIVEGTVEDPKTCARAAAGVDYVFHEAALVSVPQSMSEPERTHNVNTGGTLNVLRAAADAR